MFCLKYIFFCILFTSIYCDVILDDENYYLENGEYIAMIVIDKINFINNNKRNEADSINIKDAYIKELDIGYLIISKDLSSLENAINDFSFLLENGERVIEQNREITFLNDIPKHLDRIDQIDTNYDNIYNPPNNGKDQYVYVVDTGINKNHLEFNNRVVNFYDGINGCTNDQTHGTSVAGYVGGNTTGAASQVNIINVPFYDETKNCNTGIKLAKALLILDDLLIKIKDGSIINMSWSFIHGSPCIDFYMEKLYKIKNIILIAAAGNGASSIETSIASPQRSKYVINVGAIDAFDKLASFSNFGIYVDIYAQGVNTLHPLSTSINKYTTGSGTSFSSPLVAGFVAIILNENNTIDKTNIKEQLILLSVKNRIPQTSINNRILNFSKADTIKINWLVLSSIMIVNIIFY